MDTWPGGLQQLLGTDSFQLKLGNTLVRSEVDIGPAKVRARFTDAVDVYGCSIMLDYADYGTFTTFYKTTLANGSLPFLFDDPFTGLPATFRFADTPQITPIGGRTFNVAMNWEKLSS